VNTVVLVLISMSLLDSNRDKFVCGIANDGILRKLLAEKDLTLDKAKSIALAMEAAAKDSREIQESSSAPVNKISGEKGSGGRCFRCGSLEHMANVYARTS